MREWSWSSLYLRLFGKRGEAMSGRVSVLETKNLVMRFGGLTAVNDFSISVPEGSIVGLIGPNGAGKTTAFNMITGFYRPTEGQVIFQGQDITGLPPHEVCRAGIARTFQNIRLFGNESVLQNVMIACQVRQKLPWWHAPLFLPGYFLEEKEIREKSLALLDAVNLRSHADERAPSLPYGAQRRLEIARALATEPKFLLLDEPAAGMNLGIHRTHNFIGPSASAQPDHSLIEHDRKSSWGYVSTSGSWITGCASPGTRDIRSNPKVIEAYLGERPGTCLAFATCVHWRHPRPPELPGGALRKW